MRICKKICCSLASMALLAGCLSAPAFAYGAETTEPEEVEETTKIVENETGPLTPEGNMTLVDDYHTDYSDGSGQQFITLVSKNGNYFYLVIDRASDGDETVHFMNLVDEADLLALMEDEQAEAYNAQQAELQAEIDRLKEEAEAQKEAEAAVSTEEAEDDGFDLVDVAGKFLLAAVLAAMAAGGICYVVLQEKKKRQAAKESIDPDADYREDEPEIELPLEEPEIELPLEEPEEDETDEAIRKAYQTSDGYEE